MVAMSDRATETWRYFLEIWSRALRCVCLRKTGRKRFTLLFTHHGSSTEKCREAHAGGETGGGQHDGGM